MHIDVGPRGLRSRARSVGGSGRFPWCPTWRSAHHGGTPKVVAIPVADVVGYSRLKGGIGSYIEKRKASTGTIAPIDFLLVAAKAREER